MRKNNANYFYILNTPKVELRMSVWKHPNILLYKKKGEWHHRRTPITYDPHRISKYYYTYQRIVGIMAAVVNRSQEEVLSVIKSLECNISNNLIVCHLDCGEEVFFWVDSVIYQWTLPLHSQQENLDLGTIIVHEINSLGTQRIIGVVDKRKEVILLQNGSQIYLYFTKEKKQIVTSLPFDSMLAHYGHQQDCFAIFRVRRENPRGVIISVYSILDNRVMDEIISDPFDLEDLTLCWVGCVQNNNWILECRRQVLLLNCKGKIKFIQSSYKVICVNDCYVAITNTSQMVEIWKVTQFNVLLLHTIPISSESFNLLDTNHVLCVHNNNKTCEKNIIWYFDDECFRKCYCFQEEITNARLLKPLLPPKYFLKLSRMLTRILQCVLVHDLIGIILEYEFYLFETLE